MSTTKDTDADGNNLEEGEGDIQSGDTGSDDMDGDGSPDWDPAVGPGV